MDVVREFRAAQKAMVPQTTRRSPLRVALGLLRSSTSFRFLAEFAAIGLVVFAATSVGTSGLPKLSWPTFGGALFGAAKPADPREAALAEAAGALNRSTLAAPSLEMYRFTSASFPTARPATRERLQAAAGASRHNPPPQVIEGLLADADPADPNVALVRGLATIAQGGRANARVGLDLIKRAAEQGQVAAQAVYGLSRLNPPAMLDKDPAEGRAWLERAIGAGDVGAAFLLGYSYLSGWAGVTDPARGMALLEQAAQGGHVDAMKLAGTLYLSGQGVAKNLDSAERMVRAAARAGDVEAQGVLGAYLTLANLSGWVSSWDEAVRWLTKAAEAGQAPAMHMLGMIHVEYAKEPPFRDAAAGLSWFDRCASFRDGQCLYALGYANESGTGVAKNAVQAAAYYLASSSRGAPKGKAGHDRMVKALSPAERSEVTRLAAELNFVGMRPDPRLPVFGAPRPQPGMR